MTADLDIAYERTRDNAKRIASALAPFVPRPRDWPTDLPFIFDAQAILSSEVLTLRTSGGDIDLLGEVKGLGSFADISAATETAEISGFTIPILSIDGLIRAKRAAGRPKDTAGLIELEALREARALRDEPEAGA
jgi:hypothetical protein